MSEPSWDGITRSETLAGEAAALRQRLADHARSYDWAAVLSILSKQPELVNATRPGGQSLYAVLHQAAHGGAPVKVVEQLLAKGAWRTLRTAQGERPVDIAERHKHPHLTAILTSVLRSDIPPDVLPPIQRHFHAVIRERAGHLVEEHALRLPELEPLLEMPAPKLWFPVPGMYGGFSFWLDRIGEDWILMTESWCRVVEGSGQRHIVSPHGHLLLAEGFV